MKPGCGTHLKSSSCDKWSISRAKVRSEKAHGVPTGAERAYPVAAGSHVPVVALSPRPLTSATQTTLNTSETVLGFCPMMSTWSLVFFLPWYFFLFLPSIQWLLMSFRFSAVGLPAASAGTNTIFGISLVVSGPRCWLSGDGRDCFLKGGKDLVRFWERANERCLVVTCSVVKVQRGKAQRCVGTIGNQADRCDVPPFRIL